MGEIHFEYNATLECNEPPIKITHQFVGRGHSSEVVRLSLFPKLRQLKSMSSLSAQVVGVITGLTGRVGSLLRFIAALKAQIEAQKLEVSVVDRTVAVVGADIRSGTFEEFLQELVEKYPTATVCFNTKTDCREVLSTASALLGTVQGAVESDLEASDTDWEAESGDEWQHYTDPNSEACTKRYRIR